VVGLLTPHFPLLAPEEMFAQYFPDRVEMPAVPPHDDGAHPAYARMRRFFGLKGLSEQQIRRARAAYYALVTYADSKVGELLAALEASGQGERTLVIYTADHGEMAGEHGLWWKNTFYEESSRVPLLVRRPGEKTRGRAAGTRFSGVVSLVDLARTLVEVAGAEDPGDLDGDSFLGALERGPSDTGAESWKDEAFCEYYGPATDRPHRMLRRGRWKYCYYHDEPGELFDVVADPHERRNRAEDPECRAIAGHLRRRILADWDPGTLATTVRQSIRGRRRIAAAGG
jgi:choline-sulfatase